MKIISGGQTGADQGALEAAKALGFQTGGWAPRGWRTETGPAPWLADYGLKESSSTDYGIRTRANILAADATVIFGQESPGSRMTWNYASCVPNYKVRWHLTPSLRELTLPEIETYAMALATWSKDVKVLNVAGNRESKNPGIQELVKTIMLRFLTIKP